MGRKAILGWPC